MINEFHHWFVLDYIIKDKKVLKNYFNKYKTAERIIEIEEKGRDLEKNYDFAKTAEQNCVENKIQTLTLEDKFYPENLRSISDPPAILYFQGSRPKKEEPSIAIVGSREASDYALYFSYKIAESMAKKGITIISGMAKGIDQSSHRGALDANSRTIAVLGTSILFKKSEKEEEMLDEILAKNGCVLSEVPAFENYGVGPNAINLVMRNRITSALSRAVIISECRQGSGTLHTLKYAEEQKRPVYALKPEMNLSKNYAFMMQLEHSGRIKRFIDAQKEDDIDEIAYYVSNKSCQA